MRGITDLWPPKRGSKPPRTVYVGSHEHKLSLLAAMHVDPDGDGRTTEDVRRQRAERRGRCGRSS